MKIAKFATLLPRAKHTALSLCLWDGQKMRCQGTPAAIELDHLGTVDLVLQLAQREPL